MGSEGNWDPVALPFLRHGGSSPLGCLRAHLPLGQLQGLESGGKRDRLKKGPRASQRAAKRHYGLSFFKSTLPKLCRIVGKSLGLGIGKLQLSSTTKGCVSISTLFLWMIPEAPSGSRLCDCTVT